MPMVPVMYGNGVRTSTSAVPFTVLVSVKVRVARGPPSYPDVTVERLNNDDTLVVMILLGVDSRLDDADNELLVVVELELTTVIELDLLIMVELELSTVVELELPTVVELGLSTVVGLELSMVVKLELSAVRTVDRGRA